MCNKLLFTETQALALTCQPICSKCVAMVTITQKIRWKKGKKNYFPLVRNSNKKQKSIESTIHPICLFP